MTTYRALGGVLGEPVFRPGAWDIGCDGFAVELDEDLHFNRYRAITLEHNIYTALPHFPLDLYRSLCDAHEDDCLSKGRGQARWTSGSTEHQFGTAGARGALDGAGAPRWKQRALYDFMKDLAPLVGLGAVARVSVWEVVSVGGTEVSVDTLLREGPGAAGAAALADLVAARAGVRRRKSAGRE